MSLFNEIVKKENIIQAYLELNDNLYDKLKARSYKGIDGIRLNDISFKAEEIIDTCQQELLKNKELSPVNCVYIPKKNGKMREIYIFTLKDRIKAQAIYRVLEPIFEKTYSPFLFSYRSSHPSYYAARSAVRRYLRHHQEDYVGIIDVSNYSDDIDHDMLIKKLKDLNLDDQTLSSLISFLKIKVYKDKKLCQAKIGAPAGLPLTALFANLYLSDLDHGLGKKVSLYRRVGDDLIMFDKNKDKLHQLFETAQKEIKSLKLKSHPSKSKLITAQDNFNFLGYDFHQGVISLPKKYQEKLLDDWSKLFLSNIPKQQERKIQKLKKTIYGQANYDNFNRRLTQIITQKTLVNDKKQLQEINQKFLKIITKYFFNEYSPRNQRMLKNILNKLELPSINKYYINIQNGKKNVKSLALSTGQKKRS